jgi:hypothetical protein
VYKPDTKFNQNLLSSLRDKKRGKTDGWTQRNMHSCDAQCVNMESVYRLVTEKLKAVFKEQRHLLPKSSHALLIHSSFFLEQKFLFLGVSVRNGGNICVVLRLGIQNSKLVHKFFLQAEQCDINMSSGTKEVQ